MMRLSEGDSPSMEFAFAELAKNLARLDMSVRKVTECRLPSVDRDTFVFDVMSLAFDIDNVRENLDELIIDAEQLQDVDLDGEK